MSSSSLKPTSAVFRLKKNYTNLTTEEYVDNLTTYLSNARSCKTLTIQDLTNVIYGIAAKAARENECDNVCLTKGENSDSGYSTQLHPGEHIIVFWVEGNDIKWYLGILDYIKEDKAIVSYMVRADSAGRS